MCFLAVAILLTPARMAAYMPEKAARLAPLIAAGIQLLRLLLVSGAVLALMTDAVRRFWPPDADDAIEPSWERRDLIVALVLTLAALCLRLPNAAESLWFDEIASLIRVVLRGPAVILAFSAEGNNHIANSMLMWVASRFGTEEWRLRLPSLFIGTLMPAAVYLLFQRVGQRRVGLIAAVLTAVHFRMVDFSNEARGYIGTAAFGALASIAFVALCRRWSWWWALAYVTAATAAALFVVTGTYLIAAHMMLAGGLFLYEWLRERRQPGRGEWRAPLWSAIAACWALLFGLLVSAPTLPQLADYSRHRAASFHTPIGLKLYVPAAPYLTGVDHYIPAALLLIAAAAGYWSARRNWILAAALVGPVLVQTAYFQITRSAASPRVFIGAVFPILVGLSLFVDHEWSSATLLRRAAALLVVALLAADSVPVFARYYSIGNPKLRELSQRLPARDVLLANLQAESNVFYFPDAPWRNNEPDAMAYLNRTDSAAPRFVLWGELCQRPISPRIKELGYRETARLEDWTYAEHAVNQQRPCFTLFERSVATFAQ